MLACDKKESWRICISLVFMVSLLTLRSRWTTPIWWQWSTASRICWMQWLHANTRGPWVSDKLPLTVCGCEHALTLRELLAVLVGRLYSRVATDPPSSHNEGYFGKMDHLLYVQNVFGGCHGHQLMFAVTDPEKKNKKKKKHSCNFVIVYYSHNTANSLPESQNRSGVSSWPTGGWTLTDRGGRRRSWRNVCFESASNWFSVIITQQRWRVCRFCSSFPLSKQTEISKLFWCYKVTNREFCDWTE